MEHELEAFQLLRGDVEDVILNGLDVDGEAPKLHTGASAAEMRFRYDLVNLDFLGGVGYPARQGGATAGAKRVQALKKLFERQQGHAFVLLLTVNVRDGMGEELRAYLTNTIARVEADLRPTLKWYAERGPAGKKYILKALVPLFVQRMAEDHMFQVHTYPPLAYGGSGQATMVHFAFELIPQQGDLQAFSSQLVHDLIELPLMSTDNGGLGLCAVQHPGFNFEACRGSLEFLPKRALEPLLAELGRLAKGEELERAIGYRVD
jgi:hypothetical protein